MVPSLICVDSKCLKVEDVRSKFAFWEFHWTLFCGSWDILLINSVDSNSHHQRFWQSSCAICSTQGMCWRWHSATPNFRSIPVKLTELKSFFFYWMWISCGCIALVWLIWQWQKQKTQDGENNNNIQQVFNYYITDWKYLIF